MTPWSRLQSLSCAHALQLWRGLKRKPRPPIPVPDVIRENVDILGRGDEAEIKIRVLWYIEFHPAIFDLCSKGGWN